MILNGGCCNLLSLWKLSVILGLKVICSFCSLHREKIWIIIINLINVRTDVGVLRRLNYLSAKVGIFCQNYVIQNTALLYPTTMAHSHIVLPFLVAICNNRLTWIDGILALFSLFHYILSYYGWWYPGMDPCVTRSSSTKILIIYKLESVPYYPRSISVEKCYLIKITSMFSEGNKFIGVP